MSVSSWLFRSFPNDTPWKFSYVCPALPNMLGRPAIKPPRDDTSEKHKISDKDSQSNLAFADVIDKNFNTPLTTKFDNMKATQSLVEKRILAPITIVKDGKANIGSTALVKDSSKGNPLRNKAAKKRKRVQQELSKFDEEVLKQIPPEKLAQLLESQPEDGDSEALARSLRSELKKLIAREIISGLESNQKEIVSVNPQTNQQAPPQYMPSLANNAPATAQSL